MHSNAFLGLSEQKPETKVQYLDYFTINFLVSNINTDMQYKNCTVGFRTADESHVLERVKETYINLKRR